MDQAQITYMNQLGKNDSSSSLSVRSNQPKASYSAADIEARAKKRPTKEIIDVPRSTEYRQNDSLQPIGLPDNVTTRTLATIFPTDCPQRA